MRAHVGLGGNLGDPETIVRRFVAVWRALAARPGTRSMRGASVYRSSPVGPVREQPDFYNTVFELELAPTLPQAFLGELLALEVTFDRRRLVPGGPRTLDLDLLDLDALSLVSPRLTLPHPRAHERDFVAVPVAELAGKTPQAGSLALYCAPRWPHRRDG